MSVKMKHCQTQIYYIKLSKSSWQIQNEKKKERKQMKQIKIILFGIVLMQLGIFLVMYAHNINIHYEYYAFKIFDAGIVVCVVAFIYPLLKRRK